MIYFRYFRQRLGALLLLSIMSSFAGAQQPPDVAFAGFAFAGGESTMKARFPYSQRYEATQQSAGKTVYQLLMQQLQATPPTHLRITTQLDELKGRDQALAVALVVGNETVSDETFGNVHKLMVVIRAQVMFFDFKSMNVVRSYPVSFAYVDVLDHAAREDEIMARVRLVYEGTGDKPGILARFVNSVAKAQIPAQVTRYLQVVNVRVSPEAQAVIPASLRSEPGAVETWAADLVGEAISTRAGVPIVPYSKGYAIGNVMSLRVSDGTVWQLKLPKPDYEISVDLTNFKKIKFSEVAGGATTYVYGAYGAIRIVEPLGNKVYLDTALKNGETRIIPASQQYVDDFPHFYDALNGMFVKLAQVIDGTGDEKWIKSAAAASAIEQQIVQTKELMKSCK
ncbi:hypothetical protein [Herbaspirillum rubrisubalbicans]|nr:hypothetical protein [Herbaspirillum rubrisubalbicans]